MRAVLRPAAALIALPLLLVACTGGEDCCDDLGSYFERVDEIDDESQDDFAQLDAELTQAFPSGGPSLNESTRGTIAAGFARGEAILSDVIESLEEIDPPPGVADAHFEAIEGYRDFRQSYAILRSRVPNIITAEDLISALEGQAEAGQRKNEACDALQKIADDNGIEVVLECGVEIE